MWDLRDEASDQSGIIRSTACNDITDEKSSWASSDEDKRVQEQVQFNFLLVISSSGLKGLVNSLKLIIVEGRDKGKKTEWTVLMEFNQIMENFS